ncbi:MAG: PIN domain nuclease [Solirubrobacteraceae bacterium]
MALSVILDTSVLERLGRTEVRSVIEPLAAAGRLGRPSICGLEVGYSARNADEWDRLVGALDAFDRVETTAAHVRRALQVQRLLAHRSQRGRKIPDLLIAAAAEELDVPVLHYDADFDAIASVTGQRCQWVVPAGSVE